MEKRIPQKSKNNIKKPLIILGSIVVVVVLILTLGFPAIMLIKSRSQCGQEGFLIGDSTKGYICSYNSIHEEYKNNSQCSTCSDVCELKGKVEIEGGSSDYYGTHGMDVTNSIKMNSNGTFNVKKPPVVCSCQCDEK